MSFAKQVYRSLVAPVVTGLNLEKLLSAGSPNRNLILCYHGVCKETCTLNNRHMPISQFRRHLTYLKKNFNVVPLASFFDEQAISLSQKKKNIAITFDDGYKNNYETALPALEQHELPATFFIATEGLYEQDYLMWPDVFDLLKLDTQHSEFQFNGIAFARSGSHIYHPKTGEPISEYVKRLGAERDPLIEDLKQRYNIRGLLRGVNPEAYTFLNAEELVAFAKSSLVDIGSHTHKHYNLANIDESLAREELVKSRKILEDLLHKPVQTIAFPDGSYNSRVKDIAQEAGYIAQFAVPFKEAADNQDKRIRRRHAVSNSTTYEANMIAFHRLFKTTGF